MPTPLEGREISSADDWSGLTDPIERRKRQNRLNQTARRRRKQNNQQSTENEHEQTQLVIHHAQLFTRAFGHIGPFSPSVLSINVPALWEQMPSQQMKSALVQHLADLYCSFTTGSPRASQLLTLTRVNVHRAFVTNMLLLGIDWELLESDSSISPFLTMRPGYDPEALPVDLQPTALQRASMHHPWVDLFPSPSMRDNLVRAGDGWDDEELCTDIMGYWDGSVSPAGLIVWGEPSQLCNWEITEEFAKKWGWTIQGCEHLMRATNSWRDRRGEIPLFADI